MSRSIQQRRQDAPGFRDRYETWMSFVDRFASRHRLTRVQAVSVLADLNVQKRLWSWVEARDYMALFARENDLVEASEVDRTTHIYMYTRHLSPRR